MEAWRYQLNQLLDEVASYAEDWPTCLDMVAMTPESPELLEYLEQLVPRLRMMQRSFNWVTYDSDSRCYTIHNYDYKMWDYWQKRNPDQMVITPHCIHLHTDSLTPAEREQFQARLSK